MLDKLSQKITKRKIQIVLGCLWILDGLLQLQPQMFTKNFVDQVIQPGAQGQPAFIHGPMQFMSNLVLHQPALFDIGFVLVQLGIGGLILRKRTVRLGLWGSVIWGLLVWYLGEGLGGLFGGQSMLLTGAPGAALLYVLISLGVMPDRNKSEKSRPADWLVYVWMALWMGGGALLLWASMGMPKMVASIVTGMADGAPGWMASLDIHFANWFGGVGSWIIFALICVYIFIGFTGVLQRWWRLAGVGLGILFALLFWVTGQSLGSYFSGLATDPNTAPLIILLGMAVLGTKEIGMGLFN